MSNWHDLQYLGNQLASTVLGQEELIEGILLGLLADGHLLVEGVPGLAKTRAIKSLGSFLDASFSRIQFTPDLLPSDITGAEQYYGEFGPGQGPGGPARSHGGATSHHRRHAPCPARVVSGDGDPKPH